MKKIKTFSAKTVNLPNEDIDTDQIIPARFLTRQTIDGIGECLFADWRYDKSGKPSIKLKGKIDNLVKKKIKKSKYNIYLSLSDDKPWAQATVIIAY